MREFFNKPAGKIVALLLVLIGVAYAAWTVYGTLGPSDAAKLARERLFIDATTGKPYEHTLKIGEKAPYDSPSGHNGFPAELCYWTKDGKSKAEPTPVLLNSWLGKTDPTFCPDCGRLVVGRNPAPGKGVKAPPLREEFEKLPKSSAVED